MEVKGKQEYCPWDKIALLNNRICPVCGCYFPTEKQEAGFDVQFKDLAIVGGE